MPDRLSIVYVLQIEKLLLRIQPEDMPVSSTDSVQNKTILISVSSFLVCFKLNQHNFAGYHNPIT